MKNQKLPKPKNLFLIVRGEKPDIHNAPYSPIILCTRKHTAKFESGSTSDGATVFQALSRDFTGNWLLVKYKGYDIDYGNVCHYFKLFDGNDSENVSDRSEIHKLIGGAIWWSYDEMPDFIKDLGAKYPNDRWTKEMICHDFGTCLLTNSQEKKLKSNLEKYEMPFWLLNEI